MGSEFPQSTEIETLREDRVTPQMVLENPDVRTLIDSSDRYLDVIGYTDHGIDHIRRVADRAGRILRDLQMPAREAELAQIAAYLHDIGNVVHRNDHPISSALMSFQLLTQMGMPMNEVAMVIGAIANHDDSTGDPVSNPCAALIIADKSDVLRIRVRNPKMINFDIHDRVNYAVTDSDMRIDIRNRLIILALEVDTSISSVAEYFEIFLSRMHIARRASAFLNCDFVLKINDVQLM